MPPKECDKCKRWTTAPDGLCDACLIESFGIPIEIADANEVENLCTFRYVPIDELAKWLRELKEAI